MKIELRGLSLAPAQNTWVNPLLSHLSSVDLRVETFSAAH